MLPFKGHADVGRLALLQIFPNQNVLPQRHFTKLQHNFTNPAENCACRLVANVSSRYPPDVFCPKRPWIFRAATVQSNNPHRRRAKRICKREVKVSSLGRAVLGKYWFLCGSGGVHLPTDFQNSAGRTVDLFTFVIRTEFPIQKHPLLQKRGDALSRKKGGVLIQSASSRRDAV